MSRFLLIRKTRIHIPSVDQVFVGQDWENKSVMTIMYHNNKVERIEYPLAQWTECDKDRVRIEKSIKAVADVLSVIPEKEPEQMK